MVIYDANPFHVHNNINAKAYGSREEVAKD